MVNICNINFDNKFQMPYLPIWVIVVVKVVAVTELTYVRIGKTVLPILT